MDNIREAVPAPEELYNSARKQISTENRADLPADDYFSSLPVEQKNYFRKLVRLESEYGVPCEEVEQVLGIIEKYHGQPSLSSTLKFHKKFAAGEIRITEAYAILQCLNPAFRDFDGLDIPAGLNRDEIIQHGRININRLEEILLYKPSDPLNKSIRGLKDLVYNGGRSLAQITPGGEVKFYR